MWKMLVGAAAMLLLGACNALTSPETNQRSEEASAVEREVDAQVVYHRVLRSTGYAKYPENVAPMMKLVDGNDVLCRGGTSDPEYTRGKCEERNFIASLIQQRGWCREEPRTIGEARWYRC